MGMSAQALCQANCAMTGRHVDCADHYCRGCQPRRAADGLLLCTLHADRLGQDAMAAPVLYDDLTTALLGRRGAGEKVSGSSSGAPVPDDAVMAARAEIRSVLVRLAKRITSGRGVRAPSSVVRGVRYAATDAQTLGRFVATHAVWLAADVDAGRHADELGRAVHGRNRALAYPSGGDRLLLGECPLTVYVDGEEIVCGTRLYQTAERPLVTCGGCGASETAEQWQRWLIGQVRGVADATTLAAYLAWRWEKPVDAERIRQWASRGHIHPLRADDDNGQATPARDYRGRLLYRADDVLAYAQTIWRRPARWS